MNPIRFTVLGDAKPAGSKRGFPIYRGKKGFPREFTGHVVVTDANPKAKDWKKQVSAAAVMVCTSLPVECALAVQFTVYRERPKSHFRSNGQVKEWAPEYPTTKPDVLKLARGIEDALTGILYVDDAQIVSEMIYKRYGSPARVEILIQQQTMNGIQSEAS